MTEKVEKAKKGEERFIMSYRQSIGCNETWIWIDRETGVNYLYMTRASYSGGLTPLLDAEGKPVITLIDQKQ